MKKTKNILLFIILAFSISSCNASYTPISNSDPYSAINQELENITDSNLKSAQNNLNEANTIYSNLSGRLLMIDDVDTEAYNLVGTQLLPPMLGAINSLSAKIEDSQKTEKEDLLKQFNEIYSNSVSQMLRGINNNLTLYQNSLESLQSITAMGSLIEDSGMTTSLTDDAIPTLAKIFQTTESTEAFVAELGQFNEVIPSEQTQKTLDGIKNQQIVLINGIINFTSIATQQEKSKPEYLNNLKQGYLIIAQSLTTPNLLNYLAKLATSVFGAENVAYNKDELTSAQTNPNLTLMVIKEDVSVYRFIKVENGKVTNKIQNDTRGLSASDILNETNVSIINIKP